MRPNTLLFVALVVITLLIATATAMSIQNWVTAAANPEAPQPFAWDMVEKLALLGMAFVPPSAGLAFFVWNSRKRVGKAVRTLNVV